MRKIALALIVAVAGCASSSTPTKAPYKTKVDGWVEKGELKVAVADERPLASPGTTGFELADSALDFDQEYKIAEWVLPAPVAASLRKMLPDRKPLPLGVERQRRGAVVRVESAGRSFEVQTDDDGHAKLPLAAIAIAALERGEETATVSLDVADGGKGELLLLRNDLLGIADAAERLPDYGLAEMPETAVFWAVVQARANGKLLRDEAGRRTSLQLDEATAKLLVDGTGRAELPFGTRVDWTESAAARSDEKPSARIELTLERGDGFVLAFILRVTNEGAAPFEKLRARTRSNVAAAEDLILLLGRIEPGATVERRFEVASPRALRGHDVRLEVDFWEAHGRAPPPVDGRFKAAWR